MPNKSPELDVAEKWVQENVDFITNYRNGVLEIDVGGVFNCSAATFYELLTHPDNAEILRGLNRCTARKILWNNGRGHQLVEVENESEWRVAGLLHGNVRSRLLVEQDMSQGTMQFTLAPGASSPLKHMYGRWQIHPVEYPKTDAPLEPSFGSNELNASNESGPSCLVTLHQTFIPPPVPRFLLGFATKQVRRTFEDFAVEVTRLHNQNGTMSPYMSACMKEFGHGSGTDPTSVLAALEEASTTSTSRSSTDSKSRRDVSVASRASSGSSMLSNSLVEPVSYPLHTLEPCESDGEHGSSKTPPGLHIAAPHSEEQKARGIYVLIAAFDALFKKLDNYVHLDDIMGQEDDPLPGPWLVIA